MIKWLGVVNAYACGTETKRAGECYEGKLDK